MFGLVSRAEMNNTMRLLEEKMRAEIDSQQQKRRDSQSLQLTDSKVTLGELIEKVVAAAIPQVVKQLDSMVDPDTLAERICDNLDFDPIYEAIVPKLLDTFKDDYTRGELLDKIAEEYITDYLSNNELDDGIIEIISERIHVGLINQSKHP